MIKSLYLSLGKINIISFKTVTAAQMCKRPFDFEIFHFEGILNTINIITGKAQPVHTAVYLYMSFYANSLPVELPCIFIIYQSLGQPVFFKFSGSMHIGITKYQNIPAYAVFSQPDTLVNCCDSKALYIIFFKTDSNLIGTVTIGLRLYYSHKRAVLWHCFF